jgi:ADP-heptose:LPS heptosyltransferase
LRSFPVEHLSELAAVSNVTLISLHRLDESPTQETGEQSIIQFPQLDRAGAFMDTAAIITNLDLVVTCDASIAHLAGALGTRTWVALDAAADLRWLGGQDDTPWYPTMRLFRQTKLGEWREVFERMSMQLRLVCH